MAEVHFQVVKRGSGDELGPARAELQQALEDRRTLAYPEVAEIARVKHTSRGAGRSHYEDVARSAAR
jgi:hypothetical protein